MKKTVIIILSAIFLLGLILLFKLDGVKAFFSKESRSAASVQMGVSALTRGDTAHGVRKLEAAVGLNPNNAEAYYYLGRAYQQAGDLATKQIQAYQRSLEIRPDLVEARIALGSVYWASEMKAEAEREFEGVLEIDPSNVAANNNLGRIRMERGDYPLAEKYFKTALGADPTDQYSLNNLGNLFFLEKKYKESTEIYEKSLALEPRHPVVHYQLAKLAEKQGKKALAMEHWQKAIELGLQGDGLVEAKQRLAVLTK
jgi:tetratricopeptide (TPR) repeat protein